MSENYPNCSEELLRKSSAGAIFDDSRAYRYVLWRALSPLNSKGQGGSVGFVGLNPSTADETQDDPTIRRCIGYAKLWGYQKLYMVNIFGLRSTNPKNLRHSSDPVGPDNDAHLLETAEQCDLVVCAWGTWGRLHDRHRQVLDLLCDFDMHCLGITKDGYPKHPLYLRKDLKPTTFPPE